MLTVVAGDWPADSVIMFKQGFTGPKGLIISKGLLSTEELDGQAIDQLEIVADASSPLVAADNALRQTASLFLASKDAKRGASLVYIHATDGRKMLVKANSSEVTQMMALLRVAQKAVSPLATSGKLKVGCFLWIGIVFMPFLFAWFLLLRGHSTSARVVGFGWMAVLLLLIATSSSDPAPTPQVSAPAEVAEVPLGPNTYFVIVDVTDERTAPGGGEVENRIYRGQRVEVTDTQGEWVRVTRLKYTPRWVRASHLSRERPGASPQATLAPDLSDPRIHIGAVGEYGLTESDVRALRTAGARLLASGECQVIEDGAPSSSFDGVYYVNCGENFNRFFRFRDGEPQFCGRSGGAC